VVGGQPEGRIFGPFWRSLSLIRDLAGENRGVEVEEEVVEGGVLWVGCARRRVCACRKL